MVQIFTKRDKSLILLVYFPLIHCLNFKDMITTTTTSPLVRIDGAFYPATLIGPSTHGPNSVFVKETTLKLNGYL